MFLLEKTAVMTYCDDIWFNRYYLN